MSNEREESTGSEGSSTELKWLDLPATPDRPAAHGRPSRRTSEGLLGRGSRLVGEPGISPVSTEQYRRLAAVLHQAQVERGIKSIMVASAFSGEGKTLTAANLALTLSGSFLRKVLLVDADLRRPNLHDVFRIPNLEGLSDGLKSKTLRKMPLVEITPNLSLLPGGRPDPDPVGGLTSERMKHVVQQAGERFDWLILDTPPVVLLPDGNLVATMVDTVLLVVAAGRTPSHIVQRAVDLLGRDRIIGALLNFVDTSNISSTLQSYDYHRRVYPAPAPNRTLGAL